MIAKGPFQITMQAEPPYDEVEGVTLARAAFDKRFSGPLEATSKVHMLSARTPVAGSAAYVALEHIRGTLDGKTGTFATIHQGLMTRGTPSLSITIVPDSGTGELRGLAGTMSITQVNGQHFYEIDYTLGTQP